MTLQSAEEEIIKVRSALVRIATLMLKVPMDDIAKHLSTEECNELVRCYIDARQLVK
jgi:hypothetical protein